MHSWFRPHLPVLAGPGPRPQLQDTATGQRTDPVEDGVAGLYVCGITPYDSTHLGHAFTYVAFDTLNRVWRDAGVAVTYVQNVTDVDDPLLERAEQTGVDWRELAADQVQLFRTDMQALRVLPPEHYVGVVEVIDLVVVAVERVLSAGGAYWVEQDVYADLSADPRFGSVSNLDRAEMARLSAERGGDPDRQGKKDPLDPLLWRGDGPASLGGTARASVRAGPAGTSSAVRSLHTTWVCRSPSRAAGTTWSSRTTRWAPATCVSCRTAQTPNRSGPTCTPAWSPTRARR